MASSTTIPNARIKANIVIMLIETPKWGMMASAPKKDMGIPRVTQIAREKRRNRANTRKTSIPP